MHVFHLFALFPVIASLHHLIMIMLIGSEGRLMHHPGSEVPLIGLGGQEKLEMQLIFVITNHVGVEKDVIPLYCLLYRVLRGLNPEGGALSCSTTAIPAGATSHTYPH